MPLDQYGMDWPPAQFSVDPVLAPDMGPPPGMPITSPSEVPSDVAPQLTPEEEAQIQVDQAPPGPPPGPELGEMPAMDVVQVAPMDGDGALENPNALVAPPPAPPGTVPAVPPGWSPMYGLPGAPADTTNDAGLEPVAPALTPDQEIERKAAEPAEKYIERMAKEEQAKRDAFVAGQLEANKARLKQAELDHQAFIAAQQQAATDRAQIETDAKNIAKVDPQHWMHEGTLQTLASIAGVVIAGLAAPYNGGRNFGLEVLNKKIDNDIAAQNANISGQRADLARRSQTVGENLQSAEQTYRANETYRAAVYESAINDLQTQMQDFDPKGTTALAVEGQIRQYRAAQQTALQASQDKKAKRLEEGFKIVQEQEKIDETQRHNMAEEQAKAMKAAGAGGAAAVKVFGTTFKSLNDVPPKDLKNAVTLPADANGDITGFVIAPNEESAKKATHIASMYSQVDHDLNELQKISQEREGARSAGGAIWSKWKETGEQRYDGLMIHFANVYGSLMHGDRPLPAGTLEEVLHSMPQLKGFYEGGDTTALLDGMRNDVDTRTGKQLSGLVGQRIDIKSQRPYIDPSNSNVIAAPLLSATPVVGDRGYARIDIKNADESLKGLFKKYQENPGLGGQAGLEGEYNRIADAQRQASAQVEADVSALKAKKTRTPAEEQRLKTGAQAIRDYEQVLRAIDDNRKASVEDARKKAAKEKGVEAMTHEQQYPNKFVDLD